MGACFAGASPALQHAWRQLSIANNEHCKQRASVEHWTSIANNEHWTSIGRALQTTRIGRALDEHCKQRELDEHWTSIANNENWTSIGRALQTMSRCSLDCSATVEHHCVFAAMGCFAVREGCSWCMSDLRHLHSCSTLCTHHKGSPRGSMFVCYIQICIRLFKLSLPDLRYMHSCSTSCTHHTHSPRGAHVKGWPEPYICSVYIHSFLQGFHRIYTHTGRIYTALADSTHVKMCTCKRPSNPHCLTWRQWLSLCHGQSTLDEVRSPLQELRL